MYSRKLINQALDDLAARGTHLTYYTPSYIEACTTHLHALAEFDSKSKFVNKFVTTTRPLDPDELAFIKNERLLCALDYHHWASNYHYIRHAETMAMIKFHPNYYQQVLNLAQAKMQEANLPIEIQLLKARQGGGTTDTTSKIQHRAQFVRDTSGVIASSDPDKSWKLSEMISRSLVRQPWWLLSSTLKQFESGEVFLEDRDRNISITIQHGAQQSGIAQGDTINIGHFCVSEGEFIPTGNGFVVPIESIRPGDLITTSTGQRAKVKSSIKSPRKNEQATSVKLWCTPFTLLTTKDHKVLTDWGWVEAGKLKKGDFIVYPVRPITNTVTEAVFVSSHSGYALQTNSPLLNLVQPLTRDFGRVCGLYIAEGSIRRTNAANGLKPAGIAISMNKNEREQFTDILLAGLPLKNRECVGYRPRKEVDSLSASLAINSAHLGQFFVDNFGCNGEKFIPDWAWDAGREFCLGLIEGYITGDGHIRPNSVEVRASSVCPAVIFQLRDLIASCGFGWTSIYTRAGGSWYGRNCKQNWTIVCAGEVGQRLRQEFGWEQHDIALRAKVKKWKWLAGGHIGVQVSNISAQKVKNFYDLEIDSPEHNFTTIHGCVHNSELPYWTDPRLTLEMGFMPAHHPSSRTLIVYESTADGRKNWWHEFWKENKEQYALHQSIIQPLFLPWYLSREIYPSTGWLEAIPVKPGYQPSDHALAHARAAQDYVRSNEFLRSVLGVEWEMPIEQIWWYQFEYEKAVRLDNLAVFLSTTPATDTEAFQSKSKSVFSIELIQSYEVRVPPPVGVFKLRGTELPTHLEPSSEELLPVTDEHKTIEVTYNSTPLDNSGVQSQCRWSLLPIKFQGYPSVKSHLDTLWIWEYPRSDSEYCVSLDASQGIGRDRTAITVVRKGTPGRVAGQVAAFSTDRLGGLEIWPVCLMLLSYYSTFNDHLGRPATPLFSPETASDGGSALMEIRKRGYNNLYLRRSLESRDLDTDRVHQYGWQTGSTRSRDILVTWLLRCLRGHFYELNSYWSVDEMRDFVAKEPPSSSRTNGVVKIEHDKGAHDDELFSNAIGIVTVHALDIYQGNTPQWASMVQRTFDMINFPTYASDVTGATFRLEEFVEDGAWQRDHGEVFYPRQVPLD